ncbi:CopD family protein [Galenea microaerophila]
MQNLLLWLIVFHILFVMSWMAGLFYLPRIFVHYVEGQENGEGVDRLVVMAQKLYKFMTLIMMFAIGTGIALWVLYFPATAGWLHVKVTLVLLLLAYHLWCKVQVKRMAENHQLNHTGVFYRWMNEIPLFLLFGILVLVVFKPF